MASNQAAGRLRFTTDFDASVAAADIVMIAVGTPPDPANAGQADLQYVFAAAEQIAKSLSGYTLIVCKSTVPIGTNERIANVIHTANPDADFDVASNPEFLREGSAIDDFMKPDRIVIGVGSERAASLVEALYTPLTQQGYTLLKVDIATAEMIKYASNSFLAARIAFINEIADICEQVGADVEQVAKGMGMDARIGERFLRAGPGYGGSCFPKDTVALQAIAQSQDIRTPILQQVIDANAARKEAMADRVIAACGADVQGHSIAVLGLTFKANTDDMRESPALDIVAHLTKAGANIRAYDPEGMENAKALLPNSVVFCEDAPSACHNADAVCIVTEWKEFAQLNLQAIRAKMRGSVMVDLRNLYDPETVSTAGLNYHSIGRATAFSEAEGLQTASA
jgi:UDPglucose 6-dehydrogenase